MITSIRLQSFRSYLDDSFEFEPGINIIVGPNASGKTNILEAVLTLASGSSFRARDIELVNIDKPWCRVEADFDGQQRILKIKRIEGGADKTIETPDKAYKRLSYGQRIPFVFFEPGDLQKITRSPEQRRELIDSLLEKSLPDYKTTLNHYRRTLSQRNSLLKRGPSFGSKQIFAWNLRLAELGEKIAISRQDLIELINKQISKTYSNVAQSKSKVLLEYVAQFQVENYATKMLKKLELSINHDYLRGFTAYGPHREDINFFLNKRLVNQTASRGEIRSIILALKIYELGLVEKARGVPPIVLLDDVFSELDGARRGALVEHLSNYQTIITTTDADSVLAHFSEKYRLIAL